ncbi:hypothetical protein BDN72DRAFT_831608 [Pluteus cervinus]|uniref:Uncharacterized protein n=1 Tax=Pluteus cervinus TaxID=181527 RepID=A0ACD3BER8_9AGAR|nr:hypothetical protein BDN72DRAFT_831608 [Pluteus cervinus]
MSESEEGQGTEQMVQTELTAHIEVASNIASPPAPMQNPEDRCNTAPEREDAQMCNPGCGGEDSTLMDLLDCPHVGSPHADSAAERTFPEEAPHDGTQRGDSTDAFPVPNKKQDGPPPEESAYIQPIECSSPHEQAETESTGLAASVDTLCTGDDQLDCLPASSPPPSSSPIRLFLSSSPQSPQSPDDTDCNVLQIDLEEVNQILSSEMAVEFLEGPVENISDTKEETHDQDDMQESSAGPCEPADEEEPETVPRVTTTEGAVETEDENEMAIVSTTIQNEPRTPPKAYQIPNPKRPTLAMQKSQHKKLIKPFKTPALVQSVDRQETKRLPVTPSRIEAPTPILKTSKKKTPVKLSDTSEASVKHRTLRAAGQFKSPLSATASSNILSDVRLTPTVQVLERRLQALKRAVRIKQEGDQATLQELIKKWTEAGREIAWEVWNLVKDNATEGDPWAPDKGKRAFQESWGWDGQGENKKPCTEPDEGGDREGIRIEKIEADDDEAPEKKQDTLGTMLMQLGIDPDTLGWNEEEDDFNVEILD